MERKKIVKYILYFLLLSCFLLPLLTNLYLIYRVDRLEKKVIRLSETASSVNDLQTDVDLEHASETAYEVVADALESQITWDIALKDTGTWNSNDGIRKVYLTFDDGPSKNTDKILDILDTYGVKATFFVVGKDGFEKEYQRISSDGHTLGMHSFSHKYKEIYQSVDTFSEDLTHIQNFLYEMTGEKCSIYRFPGGSSNSVSKVDMRDLISYLKDRNISYFDWNVSSGDASSQRLSASQIADNVIENVVKYDTAVVLMHDAADRDSTVEALPIIIERLLEYDNTVLLPITEETVPIQHVH